MTIKTLGGAANRFRLRVSMLWQRARRLTRQTPRRLRLCESLPLGERRFVAVVEFDAARFLVGGTSSSLVLLSRLGDAGEQARDQPQAPPWNAAAAGKAEAGRVEPGRVEATKEERGNPC
jgi:flagellar biogenesis protein FliO